MLWNILRPEDVLLADRSARIRSGFSADIIRESIVAISGRGRLLPKVSRKTIECYLVLHEGLDRLDLELTSLNEDLECVFACGQQIEN